MDSAPFSIPCCDPVEGLIYRLSGVKEEVEQRWTQYAGALIAFSVAKFAVTYLIQRIQGFLPLNPQGFSTAHAPMGATAITPDLAFNTAVSFLEQHQLAGVRGRIDHELLHADGCAGCE